MKINIGSGKDIKPGWINLDIHNKYGADIVFDLNQIYKGKNLPFKDDTFDYVYCSHVLEDFIDPIVLIKEFIRICKVKGKIELRTPFETNQELTNIHHKTTFTLSKFSSIVMERETINYGNKNNLKIVSMNYYIEMGRSSIANFFKKIIEIFYNAIPYRIVEHTFIKYLFCVINCRVVYEKTK